jgi:CRP-like cAMP-binding protein
MLLTAIRTTLASNQLLSYLSESQQQWFCENCPVVDLVVGDVLNDIDEPINYVYFPITGFISLLSQNIDNQSLKLGLIGNEGMLGATLTLGNINAPMKAIVQGKGISLRIVVALILKKFESNHGVRALITKYLFIQVRQLALTAACNKFHEVKQRLARCLLSFDDRSSSEPLYFTHQFLAKMLGVRRSAITIAAGQIQQQGYITYSRGQVVVLSKAGLEKVSCSCYFAATDVYQKYLKNQIPITHK